MPTHIKIFTEESTPKEYILPLSDLTLVSYSHTTKGNKPVSEQRYKAKRGGFEYPISEAEYNRLEAMLLNAK